MKKCRLPLTIELLILLCACEITFAISVQTAFDVGFEGWTFVGSGEFLCEQSGGNPRGFVKFIDVPDSQHPENGDGWIVAPEKFLGDWSFLDGKGVLSWDHIIIQTGGEPKVLQGQVMISGPGGSAKCTTLARMTKTWQSFCIPIDEPCWQVSSGSWTVLISNITELQIRIEAVWNNSSPLDIDGIENILLTGARTLRSDLNNDGIVNFRDMAILAGEWLQTEEWY